MANEFAATAPSGQTLYVLLRNAAGQTYNSGTSAFETYNSANYTTYALALAEQGATGFYLGSVPGAVSASGRYMLQAKQQLGTSAAASDTTVAAGALRWNGTAEVDTLLSADKTGYALTSGEHTLLSGTDVPAALTAQGYTTARAGYLDTLNGVVAAVWAAATSALTTTGSIGKLLATFGFTGSNVNASTQGYGTGQDPATLTLVTPANKLATTSAGAVQHDLGQAVPMSNTPQTVGDALNGARAQALGKWTLVGTTLNLYAADGTTIIRTFALDSASAPTQRV